MLKIKQIKIRNFRSIVSLDLDVNRMNVFVGLNDAGKSNVLKALNLFFNYETEPGVKFDFDIDYSKYAPIRKKQAKEIIISIVFDIPKHYKDNEDVEWTKKWRAEGLHEDCSDKWVFSRYSKTPTLLKRVKYKYVPAVKSDNYFKELLADLYVSIAREANEELTHKANEYSESLKEFTHEIGNRVNRTVGINSNLIMPANQVDIFKELIFMTNDKSGENINLSSRGDGIKAIHIPAILKYISEQDNKIMTNTAVPVTFFWGYEEPENGIEMKKCFDLAKELYGSSDEIQLFVTTHSPAFYQLRNKDGVNVYYVYKSDKDYASKIEENNNDYELHDKVGILPLIAPFVEEKQHELDALHKLLDEAKFMDRDTIFVEGVTDKEYFKMAINVLSPDLSYMLQNGSLKIETREENGCGTGLLVDWAIAWMHLNYNSKAIVILDSDKAGKDARDKINAAKNSLKKTNSKLKVSCLKETDEIKAINKQIDNSVSFTVEHLLSCQLWEDIVKKKWVVKRNHSDMMNTYMNAMDMKTSLEDTLNRVTNNSSIKDTILLYMPNKYKKDDILKMVRTEIDVGNSLVMNGFKNTIDYLEKELL